MELHHKNFPENVNSHKFHFTITNKTTLWGAEPTGSVFLGGPKPHKLEIN